MLVFRLQFLEIFRTQYAKNNFRPHPPNQFYFTFPTLALISDFADGLFSRVLDTLPGNFVKIFFYTIFCTEYNE